MVMSVFIAAILPISVHGNLAQNPSMEGSFIPQGSLGEVAEEWTGWENLRQTYDLRGRFSEGNIAHDGSKSQQITWDNPYPAYPYGDASFGYNGIYQQIDSLQAGKVYRASVWFKATMGQYFPIEGSSGFSLFGAIGADPDGGTNPNAVSHWIWTWMQWHFWPSGDNPFPAWYNLNVPFSPNGSKVSVFVRMHGDAHNYSYFYDPDLGYVYTPLSWYVNCYIDDVVVELVEIGADSTVEATSPIPANGVSYSEVMITVADANGKPLANIPASEIVIDCTGSGNTIIGPDAPTDAYGQTTARITSTVAETKTVSVTVFGTLVDDTAVVEFVGGPFGPIWYVDDDATGADDGSSWADAFNHLQDALAAAQSGHEIHVAQGNYKPDQGLWIPQGSRYASFQLTNGVGIKGGYAGFGEPDPNSRDIELYETILSGDLAGNDVDVNDPCDLLDEPTRSENSYHVVTGNRTDANAVLDGFTITGGNANDRSGGGMINYRGSPIIANCTFSENSSAGDGGGMFNVAFSSPILIDCAFSRNSADYGGGMANYSYSSPSLTNCIFSGNSADDWGGGMFNYDLSSPTVTNCTFSGNSADDFGGGMFNQANACPTLTNCTFSSNWAGIGGGGMVNDANTDPTVIDCTFSDNFAGQGGGGMANYSYSSPRLTNCIFRGNSADDWGGGMFNYDLSSPALTGCPFSSNSADYGGGVLNLSSSPILTNCTFTANSADSYGGGIYEFDNSPNVFSCVFSGNVAGIGGGGTTIEDSTATLVNCTFSGNAAANGNALACESEPQAPSNVELTNCILWNGGDEIRNFDGSTITITYSDVQGCYVGTGNLDSDPCFVQLGCWVDANDPNIIVEPNDPNAMWLDGNYRLRPDSPCIDAGDNSEPNLGATDLDGHPRIIDGDCNDTNVVDMGAYEFNYAYIGDFDYNCSVDFFDFSIFALTWFTEPADEQWNPFCNIGIPADSYIDWRDVAILCDNWLVGVEP